MPLHSLTSNKTHDKFIFYSSMVPSVAAEAATGGVL